MLHAENECVCVCIKKEVNRPNTTNVMNKYRKKPIHAEMHQSITIYHVLPL